jgi:hypothetical protein
MRKQEGRLQNAGFAGPIRTDKQIPARRELQFQLLDQAQIMDTELLQFHVRLSSHALAMRRVRLSPAPAATSRNAVAVRDAAA